MDKTNNQGIKETTKTTNKLLTICFVGSIIYSVFAIIVIIGFPFLLIISPSHIDSFFFLMKSSLYLQALLGCCSLINWVYCMIFWYKYDKYSKSIFGLVLLHFLYAPFYYYLVKIKKRKLYNKI
jgi:hypothetical protein